VARYREKDELDLAWNKIRRRVTRDTDTRIMDFREELINTLLVAAWDRYTKAIERGEKPMLEDEASVWIEAHLKRYLAPALEEVGREVADRPKA
jgi:hypothetical protein